MADFKTVFDNHAKGQIFGLEAPWENALIRAARTLASITVTARSILFKDLLYVKFRFLQVFAKTLAVIMILLSLVLVHLKILLPVIACLGLVLSTTVNI